MAADRDMPFARLAKKLVRVPKKEIDEKAEEWKRERRREGSTVGSWLGVSVQVCG